MGMIINWLYIPRQVEKVNGFGNIFYLHILLCQWDIYMAFGITLSRRDGI